MAHLPGGRVFSSAVNLAASLHLAAAISNATYLELDRNVNRLGRIIAPTS